MLTGDLLRYDIDDKNITPRYIPRKYGRYYLAMANDLLAIYRSHIGKTKKELETALNSYRADWAGYKIVRGLTKMIDSYAEYRRDQDIDYIEERRRLFEEIEKFRPIVRTPDSHHTNTREVVLDKIVRPLAQSLYGDLPGFLKLERMTYQLKADELIRRYNLALAQGLLYRCVRMHVWLWDSYKTVFRYLKLAGLIHHMQKQGDHYFLQIDGPLSLFRKTRKYGVNLARFLPGLILAHRWAMKADIHMRQGFRDFLLDHKSGLDTHYKRDNPFDSVVEETFYKSFKKQASAWDIQREAEIINLGDTVFIPDFTFTHPNGRAIPFEIVGFWTPEYLRKKIDKIERAGRKDLIVAVNENLNCSKDNFTGPVIFYKTRVKAGDVLSELEKTTGLV